MADIRDLDDQEEDWFENDGGGNPENYSYDDDYEEDEEQ